MQKRLVQNVKDGSLAAVQVDFSVYSVEDSDDLALFFYGDACTGWSLTVRPATAG